jgi:hypothetical protein
MNLSKQKNWIQIRIIKLPKARFFDTPDSLRERKGYLIKNDVVKVLSKNTGGWYNIEYNPVNSSTKSTYGWLREEDFYDIDLLKWDNLKSNK